MTNDLQLLWNTKASIERHSVSIAAKLATIRDPATIRTRPLLLKWPPDPQVLFEPGLYTDKYSSYTAEDGKKGQSSTEDDKSGTEEVDWLTEAVKCVFQDVIPPSSRVFVQIKSEDWEGAFIDIHIHIHTISLKVKIYLSWVHRRHCLYMCSLALKMM